MTPSMLQRLRTTLLAGGLLVPWQALGDPLPLHSWWSQGRLDTHVTTHPSWRGSPGERRSPSYSYRDLEARILPPTSNGAGSGTVGLYKWWDPDRADNSTLSHPSWRGSPGERRSPKYGFAGFEGYIFSEPYAGTVPLHRWYRPPRGGDPRADNRLTSHPGWSRGGKEADPEYAFSRVDGWALPPQTDALARGHTAEEFGYGMSPQEGTVPLLVILVDYAEMELQGGQPGRTEPPESFFSKLLFGPDKPNIVDYFREISYGRFTFEKAGIVRVRHPLPGDQALADPVQFDRTLLNLTDAAIDYSRFDRPDARGRRDGVIDRSELQVMTIVPDHPADGGNPCLGQSRGLASHRLDGVDIRVGNAAMGWRGELKAYAEELMHSRGPFVDLYGPAVALNPRASVFSGTLCRESSRAGTVHLDPWHKMIAGWMRPRVVPITKAGGTAGIAAAQFRASYGYTPPILFYDPEHGLKEFFLVEYRTPRARATTSPDGVDQGYDDQVGDQGIAVWYVERTTGGRNGGGLVDFRWPPPVVPIRPGELGTMNAAFLVGKAGLGKTDFWREEDGEFALRWPNDGRDAGLRLKVGPLAADSSSAILQWRHKDVPFLPRLDRVIVSDASANGNRRSLTIDGIFPLDATLELRAHGSGRSYGLGRVPTASATRRLISSIDSRMERGHYEVTVRDVATGATSNGVFVTVN